MSEQRRPYTIPVMVRVGISIAKSNSKLYRESDEFIVPMIVRTT